MPSGSIISKLILSLVVYELTNPRDKTPFFLPDEGAWCLDRGSKVLIGHKDPLARAYLRGLLERTPGVGACLEADSFNAVVDLLKLDQATQLALIDIDLPGMAADLGFQFFGMHYDKPRFAVLFSKLSTDRIDRLLHGGIAGCISKHLPGAELIEAFRTILAGSIYLPPNRGDEPDRAAIFSEERHDYLHQELTERQGEVLQLLALGHSNREIGQMLNIAEGTVKVHVNAAFRVLGVHNRVSAAAAIRQRMDELLLSSANH